MAKHESKPESKPESKRESTTEVARVCPQCSGSMNLVMAMRSRTQDRPAFLLYVCRSCGHTDRIPCPPVAK